MAGVDDAPRRRVHAAPEAQGLGQCNDGSFRRAGEDRNGCFWIAHVIDPNPGAACRRSSDRRGRCRPRYRRRRPGAKRIDLDLRKPRRGGDRHRPPYRRLPPSRSAHSPLLHQPASIREAKPREIETALHFTFPRQVQGGRYRFRPPTARRPFTDHKDGRYCRARTRRGSRASTAQASRRRPLHFSSSISRYRPRLSSRWAERALRAAFGSPLVIAVRMPACSRLIFRR